MTLNKVLIVAEVGTSHGGNLNKARDLIDCVKSTGCDAVKFQWVYANEILHPLTGVVKLPAGDVPLYDTFKQLECPLDFYKECCEYAHKSGLKFICSPFGPCSLSELISINPDMIKIASPELNYTQLLNQLQKSRGATPVILSSGVSKLSDIEHALSIVAPPVTLLHCVTSYPAPPSDYNLRLISTLRAIFGIPTGLSDHSREADLVPTLATMLGAEVIEKHITLSRDTDGLDDKIALTGEEFAYMVHCVHQTTAIMVRYGDAAQERVIGQLSQKYSLDLINSTLGNGVKALAPSEKSNYGRTNRSLHYMQKMHRGDLICEKDIGILRTEKLLSPGLPPQFLSVILGRHLQKDVESGGGVKWEDFLQ